MTETDLGRVVTLSTTQRNPEMEERFNIFPGRIYGVRVSGMNPQMSIGYVGVLESITMHIDRRGFDPRRVELRDGLMNGRTPFEREEISLMSGRLIDFGYVKDEKGFRRRRERYSINIGSE
ncbi:hypothetical protein HYX11_02030 [Candidatus Woesearchaeota archaeon]|nr:hypothetical protein [Candidatus Woesearchaeota archaeon]